MSNNKKLQIALVSLFVLLLGGAIYLGYQSAQPSTYGGLGDEELTEAKEPRDSLVSPRTDGEVDPDSGDVIAGGVERPAADLAPSTKETQETDGTTSGGGDDPLDYGLTPPVALDATEQTLAVAEAFRSGTHPERLSALAAPAQGIEGFDVERYSEDKDYRKEYLRVPGPTRVFAPAQPGPGVESIQMIGPLYQQIEQGESVTLRVALGPDGVEKPVTFTSFDLGVFGASQLTTVTVEANERGVAEAIFTAPPGTIDDVRIMAASPVTTGQVRFVVNVVKPSTEGVSGS